MKLNKEKIFSKNFYLIKFLPRSIANVGVHDNGIERDKYV
jgi:hypothetical protein